MSKASDRPEAAPEAVPHILLVDDFTDNREMYAEFLIYSGLRVSEAIDGHEALRKANTLLPDLIVMDLSLPGLDGWEATRRLKADPRTRSIPVVALTGHALEGHAQSALEAGCDGFIIKPCEPGALLEEIKKLLRERGNQTRANSGRKGKA
jgi:CheY-like chemotaxis protein